MGRGDQVGGVRRSLGVSESLLRQSLLEIDTATFARMVSRGLLHGKTFLSRPLTVRIYFKFSVTQFDNVLCGVNGMATSRKCGRRGQALCPLASWRTRRRGGAPVAAGGVAARGSVGLSDGTEWKAQAVPPGSRAGARLFQRLVRSSPPTHASDTGWAPVDWSNGEGGR